MISANLNTSGLVKEIWTELARQTEGFIGEQLADFVSRGLIVLESEHPVLVRDSDSDKYVVRHAVRLKLKDREYIESLERQIKELTELVQTLRGKT